MTRSYYTLLTILVLTVTGCGSASEKDASLRASVEAEQLQHQLQVLNVSQQ